MTPDTLTIPQAAQRLACSEHLIRCLIRGGDLPAQRPVGGRRGYVIPTTAVQELERYATVAAAAHTYGCSVQWLHRCINEGRIAVRTLNNRRYVSRADVQRLTARRKERAS
jgi:excisionase family DNA binding protein